MSGPSDSEIVKVSVFDKQVFPLLCSTSETIQVVLSWLNVFCTDVVQRTVIGDIQCWCVQGVFCKDAAACVEISVDVFCIIEILPPDIDWVEWICSTILRRAVFIDSHRPAVISEKSVAVSVRNLWNFYLHTGCLDFVCVYVDCVLTDIVRCSRSH